MSTEKWKVLPEKAMSSIELHLSDEVICNVMEEKSTKETWEKLEKLYMGKTLSNKLTLKDQLYGLKMEKGGDVIAHLNNFNWCISDLIQVDVKYGKDDKALLLLRSLPNSFKHFLTTLLFGKETLQCDTVECSERGRTRERSKSEKNSRSKSRKKNVECYGCGKKGNYKQDCRKLKAEIKERKKAETSSTANVVSEDNGELLSVVSTSYASDAWILDSGCSFHMCANRDWFDTYESQSGGEILMGNNATCKVIGIGTIKIKMFDGIVKTLSSVRHVPTFKKNLISLGTLDTNGCSFTTKDGVINVCKRSMVMMRGVKGFKLYDMANKKKILRRDVAFDEASLPNEKAKDDGERGVVTEIPITTKISDSENEEVQQEVVLEEPRFIAQERPMRVLKPPQRYGWDDENGEVHFALMASEGDPTTFNEAIGCHDRESWVKAMMEEMKSLEKNSVWELVPKPKD
ncbi:hypothetical protein LWI28_023521 [Acer negundo]|uniref:CCHC-type domain-containing protein n=1 Tax=Acer negundo TaxID=4023 RepID=A0AAD5NKG9_ACENE|nr:hypothetical protein LWI28_023521 [Acer negundo]